MNISFVICGNAYSESLIELYGIDGLVFRHISNGNTKVAILKKILKIFLLIPATRSVAYFLRIKFIIFIPHLNGLYGKLVKYLKPDQIYLLDDGITFEYWSDFHEKNILPLLKSPKMKNAIGPRVPNWPELYLKKENFIEISRKATLDKLFEKSNILTASALQKFNLPSVEHAVIIDDGQFSQENFYSLKEFIKQNYALENCLIVSHPTRKETFNGMIKLNYPIENYLINNKKNIIVVFGRASTALFNIASFGAKFSIFSLISNNDYLDESMRDVGIKLVKL